jgi:hypothetical protein
MTGGVASLDRSSRADPDMRSISTTRGAAPSAARVDVREMQPR